MISPTKGSSVVLVALALGYFTGSSALGAPSAAANDQVDLALVIAVDVSRSMDNDEQQVARQGYVDAFLSADVLQAILEGATKRIAVTYMEWSDPGMHTIVVPWTVIDGKDAAAAFANRLSQAPLQFRNADSMSDAILFSAGLFDQAGVTSPRWTIDVSGNGPNTAGEPVTQARDSVTAQGITINGLPIDLGPREAVIPDLTQYYQQCVIGGPEAFLVSVNNVSQLPLAIRRKLVQEIALAQLPSVVPVQSVPVDCMIGEKLRDIPPPLGARPSFPFGG